MRAGHAIKKNKQDCNFTSKNLHFTFLCIIFAA